MSSWHRENPELIGTSADPWMGLSSYRDAMRTTPRICNGCLTSTTQIDDDGLCPSCGADA